MDIINTYWKEALKIIEEESSSPVSFETWILPLEPYKIEKNKFILKTDEPFYKEMIDKRYIPLIKNSIKKVARKEYEIVIVTSDYIAANEKNKSEKTQNKHNNEQTPINIGNLNPRYVFESFVVGNSNRFAHASALAVAQSPAKAFNPLFLYGGVGLGKTHLMHSIAHFILNKNPSSKVIYISSETFTNELINSIKNNKNEEFRNKYRNIDVLLIDDIQFISQKESTQEEFFHTFNTLYESNKQIIISSDRPPREIQTLENRLRSRFECGLIADIQAPDYETRIAILRKKADNDNIILPDNVMSFIAKHIVSNIRELEGALTRTVAFASLTKQNVTIDLTKDALKDIFSEKSSSEITIELIQEIVSNYYDITVEDIKGNKKPKSIAFPRQIAMYLSRKILDLSLPKIGEKFGKRDHSTVIHNCLKIEKQLKKDNQLQEIIMELEGRIRGK